MKAVFVAVDGHLIEYKAHGSGCVMRQHEERAVWPLLFA